METTLIYTAFSALAQLYLTQEVVRSHVHSLLKPEQIEQLEQLTAYEDVRTLLLQFAGHEDETAALLQAFLQRKSTIKLLLRRFGMDTSWVDSVSALASDATPAEFLDLIVEHALPSPPPKKEIHELTFNPNDNTWSYT